MQTLCDLGDAIEILLLLIDGSSEPQQPSLVYATACSKIAPLTGATANANLAFAHQRKEV
jgi:hypothetical protein